MILEVGFNLAVATAAGFCGFMLGRGERGLAREIATDLGYADGYANGCDDTRERIGESSKIERERLALILADYDVCVCGRYRHQHNAQVANSLVRCPRFRLDDSADPLETKQAYHDGHGTIIYETLTVIRSQKKTEGLEEAA
jgi:hypothetical protein